MHNNNNGGMVIETVAGMTGAKLHSTDTTLTLLLSRATELLAKDALKQGTKSIAGRPPGQHIDGTGSESGRRLTGEQQAGDAQQGCAQTVTQMILT